MNTQPYTVMIVDDHRLFAEGLFRILDEENDFTILSIQNNGQELLHLLNSQKPDLILLDIQMAGDNGIVICQKVKSNFPTIKIVLLSMFDEGDVIQQCQNAGADGYMPKTTDAEILKANLRKIMQGSQVFLESETTVLTSDFSSSNPYVLSPRELEIIRLLKTGKTTKAIAENLCISTYTVATHRKNILKKLQLHSVKELISFAYENGIE